MKEIAWWEHENRGDAFRMFAGDAAADAGLWAAARRGEVLICLVRDGADVVLKACEGFDAARGYHVFRSAGDTVVDVWPAEEVTVRPVGERLALEQRVALLEAEVEALRKAAVPSMPRLPLPEWWIREQRRDNADLSSEA